MNTSEPHLRIVRSAESLKETALPIDLIDEIALAARLGVSRATLQSWRYAGKGPRYIKVGRLIRYRNADVESFLQSNSRGGTR